jgi:uncharacterized protein
MIILLSPSKTMNNSFTGILNLTKPLLITSTKKLLKEYQKLSKEDLIQKMKISKKIASNTYNQFQKISFPHTPENALPALFCFKGDVYKFIEPETYTKDQMRFAQKHLRILSGFYGILKPLDLIQEYRLEMALVKKFWKGKIVIEEKIILNLASEEYFSTINSTDKRVIRVEFLEKREKEHKNITIYTKYARGSMANWIIKNKITDLEKLKRFKEERYKFNKTLSKENKLVFTR